jgi:hypothetical protein
MLVEQNTIVEFTACSIHAGNNIFWDMNPFKQHKDSVAMAHV